MSLINCEVELSLKWNENCILSSAGTAATSTITDTKLYVPIVTLKIEGNAKLSVLLSKGFERSVYWNKHKVILTNYATDTYIRGRLDASFQGVNKLFFLMQVVIMLLMKIHTENIFSQDLRIKNYNIEIDGRNFYDQPINDSIKQYDEIIKISTGQGDDYTTGCSLDFAYFEKNYRLIAVDLSKQKALDADSRAIQQIIFTDKTDNQIRVYYILEQSKETILKFSKGTTKVL